MDNYKLKGADESNGVIGIDGEKETHILPSNTRLWAEYGAWKAAGGIPDPQYTTEEQSQIDYAARQDARVQTLRAALMSQFKMILALFQVGRDKGAWVVADFDPQLVTIAQTWIDLIDDYENDTP